MQYFEWVCFEYHPENTGTPYKILRGQLGREQLAARQRLEDGQKYEVQYFERVRMELHRDAQGQSLVLLEQFGRRLHPLDPPAVPQSGTTYFTETGHNVGGGFLVYRQEHGELAQFGFPLSEAFPERLEDGNTYQVQYFERARFEYRGADVLLGQLRCRIFGEGPP